MAKVPLTDAELRQRQQAPLKHGVKSLVRKREDLKKIRRQVREEFGVRKPEMNGVQRRLLEHYCEAWRVVQRLDPLNDDDTPSPYFDRHAQALRLADVSYEKLRVAMETGARLSTAIEAELSRYRSGDQQIRERAAAL